MLDKNKKKSLMITFFCISIVCLIIMFIGMILNNKKIIAECIVFTLIFLFAGLTFMLLFLKDKSQITNTKTSKNKFVKAKTKSIEQIMNDTSLSEYDKFVEWWSCCDENDIKSNSLLFGAYQVMWLDNEINNGGWDQFWDFAESWDMEQTSKLFKWLLPKNIYTLFTNALSRHQKDEDCEELNKEYDYDLMQQTVLPKLAERVVNNYRYKKTLTEYDLIEYITPYLKAQGYKKQNKRWTKDTGEFTLSFLIQGSAYDVDDYYIRPGIFVNGIGKGGLDYYGHFNIDIKQQSIEQVINDYEKFIREWTDKNLIKERLVKFIEWEKRNPLEKRRQMTGKDRYQDDPIPDGCSVFFGVNDTIKKHILDNF